MISPKKFINELNKNNINFFVGVPDSLLKEICKYISYKYTDKKNVICANEGSAIAIATGYNLSTNKIPVVYMQNSGLGNAVNPLVSLADKDVYSIPMILLIGWRGEPGVSDEPQHVKQGKITLQLLETLEIPYKILSENFDNDISDAKKYIINNNVPYALIVKKNTFMSFKHTIVSKKQYMSREYALKIIVQHLNNRDIIVSTTGKISREIFELREQMNINHNKDFLTVGSMGHANQIALGIAMEKPKRNIYCIDGDGALIMHAGGLGIIGDISPTNFKHILINNGAHDSVGGQRTIGLNINLKKIVEGFKYKDYFKIDNKNIFKETFNKFMKSKGPSFIEILVNKGARKNLGRPTISPKNNKANFIKFVNDEK